MSVLSPGRLPVAPGSVRSALRVTGHYRYRVMRRVARMTPAIGRM
jgi:hypothetical protein